MYLGYMQSGDHSCWTNDNENKTLLTNYGVDPQYQIISKSVQWFA